MIYFGIDTGTARCGWGVIIKEGSTLSCVAYGCLEPQKDVIPGDRLLEIYTQLGKLIKKYNPDGIGVEKLFFSNNAKTVMSIAEVRGVILLLVRQHKHIVLEHTPYQIKQAVTGYGNADKTQVQKMVKIILNLQEIPKPDDAADGLACAITVSQTRQLRSQYK